MYKVKVLTKRALAKRLANRGRVSKGESFGRIIHVERRACPITGRLIERQFHATKGWRAYSMPADFA